ncbi:hypothetical protein ZHAS_00017962 [Anopheles sinensis]|uniref:Uncharacterized protein n=1 Tax=Anopheles sinensis TaxID=74873 RepID=A0A084WI85_ANOSI|nr:hypothetical protein ZHAS_00017962 [Anopheles sinensis]
MKVGSEPKTACARDDRPMLTDGTGRRSFQKPHAVFRESPGGMERMTSAHDPNAKRLGPRTRRSTVQSKQISYGTRRRNQPSLYQPPCVLEASDSRKPARAARDMPGEIGIYSGKRTLQTVAHFPQHRKNIVRYQQVRKRAGKTQKHLVTEETKGKYLV